MHLAETHRQAGEWKSLVVGKILEGFRSVLVGGSWHREVGGNLARTRASHAIGRFGFPWLVLNRK